MVKLEEKEDDRISALPDDMIRHILSFLPSTKQAIQTSILSKRWRKQWTHLDVLIFDSNFMSFVKFIQFTRDALLLHKCSKIKIFHLQYGFMNEKDPQLDSKIRFATRKDVEELHLISDHVNYMLPDFLFNCASSLVKLTTENFSFMPIQKVNWGCLTGLIMKSCSLTDRAMELNVSGSPLLKYLELSDSDEFDKLVIASELLERLVLKNLNRWSNMSLIQISCPKLEELKLLGYLTPKTVKLLNSPSLLCAATDFYSYDKSLIKDILHQLRDVQELIIGDWFMMVLSSLVVKGQFSQVLNIKSLTLNDAFLDKHSYSGITSVLHNLPGLENLVINLSRFFEEHGGRAGNYWLPNLNVIDCLHLKTIKIISFPKRYGKYACLLNFIQFLLKNARALEKILVIELKDNWTPFRSKLLQDLLSSTRCSQHAVIEVLCSNKSIGE